jgi:Secretion system C-terminal sorting domain
MNYKSISIISNLTSIIILASKKTVHLLLNFKVKMIKHFLLATVATVICTVSIVQAQTNQTSKSIRVYPIAIGEADMQSDNLIYQSSMAYIRPEPKGMDDEAVEEAQIAKTKLKLANLQQVNADEVDFIKQTRAANPIIDTSWKANVNVGTPPDNSMAVNTKGQIVSMVNSNVIFYAANGANVYSKTMAFFFKANLVPGQLTGTVTNQCDPKVMFDCDARRFVAFSMTCDGSSTTSRIMIAVSKEEDPTKGWFTYVYSGDPFQLGRWFDYPKIGVSADDIFVSGNMFINGGGYDEANVWQIDKIACYAGNANPAAIVHYNLGGADFSITHVQQGLCSKPTSPHYMVASNAGASNSTKLSLYTVTGKANDANSPIVSHQQVTTNVSYSVPGFGVQPNTSVLLRIGDSRMQDAMIVDGVIHCAFHCDAGGGYAGIHYSRLTKNGANWTCSSKRISATNKEYAYPAISNFDNASNTTTGVNQSTIIGFLSSSSSDFPNMKSVVVDGAMAVSTPLLIKAGTDFVDYGLDTISSFVTTRWGDYIGMWRQHFNSVPTVWISGMYGDAATSFNSWSNHIAKITNGPEWLALANNETELKPVSASVYPNPVQHQKFTMSIQAKQQEIVRIVLMNTNGQLIDELMQTTVHPGNNVFSFNTNSLANGTYLIQVKGTEGLQIRQQIIVQH